jgi:hypothetical protein
VSVKSLVIIVEMRSDTPDGNSLGLRTTYSNVALKRVNGELFPSRQLKKKAYIPYPKGIGVLRHSYKMPPCIVHGGIFLSISFLTLTIIKNINSVCVLNLQDAFAKKCFRRIFLKFDHPIHENDTSPFEKGGSRGIFQVDSLRNPP